MTTAILMLPSAICAFGNYEDEQTLFEIGSKGAQPPHPTFTAVIDAVAPIDAEFSNSQVWNS
jgi:hypothetical protein